MQPIVSYDTSGVNFQLVSGNFVTRVSERIDFLIVHGVLQRNNEIRTHLVLPDDIFNDTILFYILRSKGLLSVHASRV